MVKKKGTFRFFYHYYKQYGRMSVHFKGVCYITDNVECLQPCETHWSKTQPNLVMRGFATEVIEEDDKIIIR